MSIYLDFSPSGFGSHKVMKEKREKAEATKTFRKWKCKKEEKGI